MKYLKRARQYSNHTQETMAKRLGVSVATIGRYEADWKTMKVHHFCTYAYEIGECPRALLSRILDFESRTKGSHHE